MYLLVSQFYRRRLLTVRVQVSDGKVAITVGSIPDLAMHRCGKRHFTLISYWVQAVRSLLWPCSLFIVNELLGSNMKQA